MAGTPEALDAVRAIRARPEMYVGAVDADGVPSRLVLQGLCHAVDEAVSGRCRSIRVEIGEAGGACLAYDVGMPLCRPMGGILAAHRLFTEPGVCRAEKRHVKVGDRVCTLGLAVLNALSERLTATVVSAGERCVLRYRQGQLAAPATVQPTDEAEQTTLEVQLDASVLGGNVQLSLAVMEREIDGWRAQTPELPAVVFVRVGARSGRPPGSSWKA